MKRIFAVVLLIVTAGLCALAGEYVFSLAGVVGAGLVFTAAGGVGANFNFTMQYLPGYIVWNDGGNPLNFLRVETKEDGVLMDLPAAAISALNGWRHTGSLASNTKFLRVANGKIAGRNVTITGQTSALGAINFFVTSDGVGTIPYRLHTAMILAGQPTEITDFAALFLPNLATVDDRCEITYHDGVTEVWDVVELQAASTVYQQSPVTVIDNLAGTIKKVIAVDSVGGGAAYVLKYALPGRS